MYVLSHISSTIYENLPESQNLKISVMVIYLLVIANQIVCPELLSVCQSVDTSTNIAQQVFVKKDVGSLGICHEVVKLSNTVDLFVS